MIVLQIKNIPISLIFPGGKRGPFLFKNADLKHQKKHFFAVKMLKKIPFFSSADILPKKDPFSQYQVHTESKR